MYLYRRITKQNIIEVIYNYRNKKNMFINLNHFEHK